jgi:hypothetical protein
MPPSVSQYFVSNRRDGTITTKDSNDCQSTSQHCFKNDLMNDVDMTDHLGYGKEKRRAGDLEILSGKVTFRWAVNGSIKHWIQQQEWTETRLETCLIVSLPTDTPWRSAKTS